jgi:phage terminase large subunit
MTSKKAEKSSRRISLAKIVGRAYTRFWNFKGRYRVVKGSRASKKSKTTALWFIYNIMKYPDANALVIRKTFNTLRTSVFTDLKWAIHRLGVDEYWSCTNSPLEMTYKPTGQKIYFRGLDDPLKITSISVDVGVLCWLWIEEAYEIMKEEDFDFVDESIRGKVEPPLFKQITITLNPWSERHFIKRRFFDVVDDEILAMTTNYLCNEWLDEADRRMFEDMKKNRPKRYQVAGLGEWGVEEGLVFENWHVEDLSDRIPSFDKIHCGCDFGYAVDPNALIKLHINKGKKEIYVFGEYYQAGMNDDELVRVCREFFGRQIVTCDNAEPKTIDYLVMNGINATPAVKGADSINRGIRWLQAYEIIIHKDCNHFIDEISQYHWMQDKNGNTMAKAADENNHLIDALRYAVEQEVFAAEVKSESRY